MHFPSLNSPMDDYFPVLSSLCLLFMSIAMLCFLIHRNNSKPRPKYDCSPLGFMRNRHRFLDWVTDILSTTNTKTFVFPSVPFGIRSIATANPANLEHILKTNFEKYEKGERMRSLFHDFLGSGIFNADGEQWRAQRKSASHEFNTKSLRKFVAETVQWEITNRLVVVLTRASITGEHLDIQDILTRFAFDNICRVSFGVDAGCLHPSLPSPPLQQAFDDAADISFGRFLNMFPDLTVRIKRMLNVGCERRLREAVDLVDKFAMNVVRSRRAEISENEGRPVREDLLSRIMAAVMGYDRTAVQKGEEQLNSDLFVKDMVVSIMLAGRDTTSSALTWFFWLLSRHPRVEKVIRSEILQTLNEQGKEEEEEIVFSLEELKGMKYLHAALCESMRLYPPVPVDSKIAGEDDVLPDGTHVRKGSFVVYSIYSMGRMDNIWGDDCMEFRPERWFKDGCLEVENAFKFPVFNAGPRMCLGKDMAFIQMKSIVASVLHRFSLRVEEEYRSRYSLSITLRMQGGLPVTVTSP